MSDSLTTLKQLTPSDMTGTSQENGVRSPSGVFIADDFRSNLIIDRHDPVFADMRASKRKHLRSANSEDAVTWNVFRSLRQIDPADWLPSAWRHAFPNLAVPNDHAATVKLWESVRPPLGLLADGDEGASEIDVVIESAAWVWFIEAKYRSDISTGTTTRPERDQVLRNLDVGTYYAGVRPFYFSLLVRSREQSPHGAERVDRYTAPGVLPPLLPHRPDGLQNLKSIGVLTWADLGAVLEATADNAHRQDERAYAARARDWLLQRGIISKP
jgi:hypothetical protein